MSKIAMFSFKGEAMCFVHVLLNAVDMNDRGYDVKIIIEGASVNLVKEFGMESSQFHKLYAKVKQLGLVSAVCRACSVKMNVLEHIESQGLPISDEMSGHPAMSHYIDEGYQVLTF